MTEQSGPGPVGVLTHVGIDVGDLERAAAFYTAVLGLEQAWLEGRYLGFKPLPGGLTLYLQKVPEEKTSKSRVHLDLTVPDVTEARARVEALGGRTLADFVEPTDTFAVVADPDGNEICLMKG